MAWLEVFNPNREAKIRLFCFPYGGGGATFFYPWAFKLSSLAELVAIQLPGHETRFDEPLLYDKEEIINELLKAFINYNDKPYIFFGHSLGALISFELIKALRKAEYFSPSHLIVSGRRAPHISSRMLPIHHLPDKEFLEKILRYDGLTQEMLGNEDLMKLILPVLRADFKVSETYKYVPDLPFDFDITAMGGTGDLTTFEEDIKEWESHTSRRFKYFSYSGNHFFIKPNEEIILSRINKIIESFN